MNRMDHVNLQYEVSNDLSYTRRALITALRDLAGDLNREADYIKDSLDYTSNELGIVQSRGSAIDVLVAKYETLKGCLRRIQGNSSNGSPRLVTWHDLVEEAKRESEK